MIGRRAVTSATMVLVDPASDWLLTLTAKQFLGNFLVHYVFVKTRICRYKYFAVICDAIVKVNVGRHSWSTQSIIQFVREQCATTGAETGRLRQLNANTTSNTKFHTTTRLYTITSNIRCRQLFQFFDVDSTKTTS